MSWLWSQFQVFALGVAFIFWGAVCIGAVRWAYVDPRGFGAKACGSLAWFFFLLAVLWLAHLSDKYG